MLLFCPSLLSESLELPLLNYPDVDQELVMRCSLATQSGLTSLDKATTGHLTNVEGNGTSWTRNIFDTRSVLQMVSPKSYEHFDSYIYHFVDFSHVGIWQPNDF